MSFKAACCVGGATLLLVAAEPAAASICANKVVGQGRAANPANYDPPRHYDMVKRARERAIAAWRAKVARGCSSNWSRASKRNVDCEGYAGGTECTASATPPRS